MKYLRYLLWLAVPLLLWWSFRHVALNDVVVALRQLSLPQLGVLIGANALVLLLFSARWWIISRAQGYPIPYLTLAGYRLASFGVSYITPGPQFGGEPLQVYLVERDYRVPRATAIAAVSLDKSLELLSNFTFLALGIIIILQAQLFPNQIGRQAMVMAVMLLLLMIGLLLAIWGRRHPISTLWQITMRFVPYAAVENIYNTIKASEDEVARFCRQQPGAMILALAMSGAIWLGIVGEFWLATYVVGLKLSPVQVISLLTAARIAFLLPMPAGLGILEAGQVLALSVMGLNPAFGLSLTLLIRVRDLALAALGLWWGGMSLKSTPNQGKVYTMWREENYEKLKN